MKNNSFPPYIEAEYEDGYIHREDENDHSPYVSGKNIFSDILERRPEPIHGKMTRFTLVTPDWIYNINWTKFPDNARPIRFKNMRRTWTDSFEPIGDAEVDSIDFGYQYTDEEGRNVQEVERIE